MALARSARSTPKILNSLGKFPAPSPSAKPTVRKHVHDAGLLDDVPRVSEREKDHATTEPDGRRLSGERGQHRQLGGEVPIVDAMLLGGPNAVETQAFGGAHELDPVVVISRGRGLAPASP